MTTEGHYEEIHYKFYVTNDTEYPRHEDHKYLDNYFGKTTEGRYP